MNSIMLFRLASILNVATAFVVTTRQNNLISTTTSKKIFTSLFNNNLGAGGMADTRDPDAFADADPRKSISAAPSFEEYLKMREGGTTEATPTAPAPAVVPVAPAVTQQQQQVAPVSVTGLVG